MLSITYTSQIHPIFSAYINPEDVGAFAAICRKTNFIVSTGSFWKSLYRK